MSKKKKNNKKVILFLIPIFVFMTYFIYTIPSTFGRYTTTKPLTVTLNITKPIYTITLDNQSADVEQGTDYIYVKNSTGFYLNSSATTQMTTTSNGITPPEKDGYVFQGYYSEINGAGTQYIDKNGKLTSSADSSNFTSDDTLYAYYKTVNTKTLYGVLEKAATEGTYAKTYTGSHQDSMDASKSTEPIYYWYGSDNTNGTAIRDKNNVIFAEQCWEMIRTTDTGGVRMIYNGEAVNNQCLDNRGSHVGYGNSGRSTLYLRNSNYWYGTDYTYDSVNRVFSISGTTEQVAWNETIAPTLIGKYTCQSSTETGTCSSIYLIESYKDTYNTLAFSLRPDTRYNSLGALQFNSNLSLDSVGYMYNAVYPIQNKTMSQTETILNNAMLSTNYWYANGITWNSSTKKFSLNSPYKVSSTSNYPSLVGKYTFRNSTQTYTNSKVEYIAVVDGTSCYSIDIGHVGIIEDNMPHTLNDYNYSYTYGDSYTDNGDGTYTINNPTTIRRTDWYSNYSNVKNKYVCKNATNNTCNDLWYAANTSKNELQYVNPFNEYKYAKGFTYDSDTGLYTLNDDESVSFFNAYDSTNLTSLNNAHYTCWNTSGTCSTLSYIYGGTSSWFYSIDLTGGKGIEDALQEILRVNTKDSIIKSGIDAWYRSNLYADYDNYIDDTIYCNDRSISSLGGWDPNGGKLNEYLQFRGYSIGSDISCPNITDRFSVSNSNAKLTYKVGLMSAPEMNLLNNANARNTKAFSVLGTPKWNSYNYVNFVTVAYGNFGELSYGSSYDVRPAISLVSGIAYSDGDGSMANPFIVDLNS